MAETAAQARRQTIEPVLSPEELRESEQRFRKLVEAFPDAILVHTEGRIVFVNPFGVRLHGARDADQLLGREISDFVRPDCLPQIQQQVEQLYLTGTASPPTEVVLIACDGSPVDVEATAIPISWNGAPAIEVVLRDIRQRKLAEQNAHQWQKRVELAQKTGLGIGLWDWDIAANTATWSDETYRQFWFTKETFSGQVAEAASRIHPEDKPRVERCIQDVLTGRKEEYASQYRVVRPDGSVCWIDAHGVMVRNGSKHMIGVGVDITDLKRNEQSLRQSEEKYRNLFENATYGIYRSKLDGTLLDVNPALVAMLGYSSKAELLARNLERDIYEDPAARHAVLASYGPSGRVDGPEANWKRKDGKIFAVRTSGGRVLAEDGSVDHYEVIVEDITERRSLEAQYRQAQKMEAVGLLAGGISHDFNNLLGVIIGNAELLLATKQSGQEHQYAEAIKKAGGRAAQLIRQLLAFSRKQVLYPTILNLNTTVSDTAKILQRLIGEDVHVVTKLETSLGTIQADGGQIEQILMNLATNARDAMPNGGTFTLRTENAELGPEHVKCHSYVKPGRYVRLSVADTGTGMSEEVRSRIFEPFFTTKPQGRGTGLGLATVYGIVKQSGGYIWVSSQPGAGTTFDIYLPLVAEDVAPVIPHSDKGDECPAGTETILLLEDEDSLRRVMSEFLTDKGYKVLHAAHGKDAIRVAIQHQGPIPLVISDVVLPEMSGPSAVKKVQAVHPEMRALYVSGYAEVPVAQRLIEEGAVVMQKPVSRIDLIRKVHEMVHGEAARGSQS